MKYRFPVEIFPIVATIWMIGGLLTTYGLTEGLNHTQRAVPYISNTGENPPESGIFTMVLALTAVQLILISTIRFKQIWDNTGKKGSGNITIHIVNIIGYCVSYISGLGMLLVGSYTGYDSLTTHILGANLAFLFGILYFILLTILSPFVKPKFKIKWLRWVILCIRIGMLLFSIVMLGLYLFISGGGNTNNSPIAVISPVAQWLLMSVLFALFLTLIPEFHSLDVHFNVQIKGKDETTTDVSNLIAANNRTYDL